MAPPGPADRPRPLARRGPGTEPTFLVRVRVPPEGLAAGSLRRRCAAWPGSPLTLQRGAGTWVLRLPEV